MKRLPGVETAHVSLNQGLVTIELKPGNTLKLQQLRKAITDQGFTPKEAQVTAIGELAQANGKLQFNVSGADESLPVIETPHAHWDKETGQQVQVSGMVSAPARNNLPGGIQITQASPQNAANPKAGEIQKK